MLSLEKFESLSARWGMADMYVLLVDPDGRAAHGYKLKPTETPSNSQIVIADLMNDGFSPLSNETWKEIGMQILEDYGCMGPGTYVIDAGPMHLDLENDQAADAGGEFSSNVEVKTNLGAQNAYLGLKKGADIFKGKIIRNPGGTNSLNKNGSGTERRKDYQKYQNARYF